jgi:hypothetical protein
MGCRKFASIAIAERRPISTLLAPRSSKKLLSKTSAVIQAKIVAKTPSSVEALRLERIACLSSLVAVPTVVGVVPIASVSAIASRNSGTGRTGDFTGAKSPEALSI